MSLLLALGASPAATPFAAAYVTTQQRPLPFPRGADGANFVPFQVPFFAAYHAAQMPPPKLQQVSGANFVAPAPASATPFFAAVYPTQMVLHLVFPLVCGVVETPRDFFVPDITPRVIGVLTLQRRNARQRTKQ